MTKLPDNVIPFKRPAPKPSEPPASTPLDVHGTPRKWAIDRVEEAEYWGVDSLERHELIAYGTLDDDLYEYHEHTGEPWAHELCVARVYGIEDSRWEKMVVSCWEWCMICGEQLGESRPGPPDLPKDLPDDADLRRRGQAVQMIRDGWDDACVTMHATCTWRADAGTDLMGEGWSGPVELVDVEPDDGCQYPTCEQPFGRPSKWGD